MMQQLAIAYLLLAAGHAGGALLTSASDLPVGARHAIDFGQFAGAGELRTQGPIQVSAVTGLDVVFTSTNPDGSLLGSSAYSLADNGSWQGITYAGLDVDAVGLDAYTMTFRFNSGPVSAAGAFINYASFPDSGFSNVIISALDDAGGLLEAWDIGAHAPISTPGAVNRGAFRGIHRSSSDIWGISFSNSAVVVTDLTLVSADVPEPATTVVVLGALLVMASRTRKW